MARNAELDWAAQAFSMLLQQATFLPEAPKHKILNFLMQAPDSVKARVTDFDVEGKSNGHSG